VENTGRLHAVEGFMGFHGNVEHMIRNNKLRNVVPFLGTSDCL
jgi:hypothetical protein